MRTIAKAMAMAKARFGAYLRDGWCCCLVVMKSNANDMMIDMDFSSLSIADFPALPVVFTVQ